LAEELAHVVHAVDNHRAWCTALAFDISAYVFEVVFRQCYLDEDDVLPI